MSPESASTRRIAYRPALAVAGCLAVGIAVADALPAFPGAYLIVLGSMLALAMLLRRWPAIASVSIALAIITSGVVAGQLDGFYYARNEIGLYCSADSKLASVRGVVEQTPLVVESPPRGRPLPDKQTLSLRVFSVLTTHGWAAGSGELPVYVSPPATDLRAGEEVQMLGRMTRPASAMNPGQFDESIELRRDRILAEFSVNRPYDIHILSQPSRIRTIVIRLGDQFRRWLDAGAPASSADRSLLRALVFGDREPVLRPIADDFNLSGTAHLLASNGARLFVLGAILYSLTRVLRISPARLSIIVGITVITFGLLISPTAQSIRPLIVFVIAMTAIVLRRRSDAIQLLSIAAIALLACRPLDLYRPGFQLGFVIVIAMVVLTPPVTRWLERFEDVDQRVAQMGVRPGNWTRLKRWFRTYLVRAIVASTIAWLAALPLVALHFEQFNLWTVPFSLLLAPLAVLATLAGFLKLVLTAIVPPFTTTWSFIALLPAHWLAIAVAAINHVPGADLAVPSPAVWRVIAFYVALCLPMFAWRWKAVRWSARCAPIAGCLLIVMAPVVAGAAPLLSAGRLRITLISLGAGQCAVIEPADGPSTIIDAGSSTLSDPLRTCIGPFLRHEGISSLGTIWLSHGDFDHISAVSGMLPRFGQPQVVTSPFFRRHAVESKPCATLLAALDESARTPTLHLAGDHVALGSRAAIDVLWPPAECEMNSNNAGLVLKLSYAGRAILFPADIQEPAERILLEHPAMLKADVLVAPHHGSAEATTSRFLEAVAPHVVVSSNATRLTAKQRLFNEEAATIPLYRTSQCGAVTIDLDADGRITIAPFRDGAMPTITWSR